MNRFKSRMLSIADEVLDLNFVLNEEFDLLGKLHLNKVRTVFPGIKNFIYIFIKSLFTKKYKYPVLESGPEFLIISGSINNDKVLIPIHEHLNNSYIIGGKKGFPIPKFWAYLFSLPYFFLSLALVLSSKGYNRKVFTVFFDRVWLSFGYVKFANVLLRRINPQYIIVANDHLLEFRALLKESKKLNIKSIYVQHAGVNEHFPPLTFDFAILDGQCSLDTYMKKDRTHTAKIFLGGSPRFDDLIKLSSLKRESKEIGIAVNLIDDIEKVEKYIIQLKENFHSAIVLRLHPAIKKMLMKDYKELAARQRVFISDATNETVVDFFKRISLLLANHSFIHFEAVLSGVPSYYLPLSKVHSDGYSFLKNGFIKPFTFEHSALCISAFQQEYLVYNICNYNDIKKGISTLSRYNDIFESIKCINGPKLAFN